MGCLEWLVETGKVQVLGFEYGFRLVKLLVNQLRKAKVMCQG